MAKFVRLWHGISVLDNPLFLNDKIIHSNFLVKGPKGSLNVKLHAESQKFENIEKNNLSDY